MRELFELRYDPSWGYDRRYFLDVEHRYTKMHRLLKERHGDLAGARILDLGVSRGLLLERFRRYPGVVARGIEIDPAESHRARARGIDPDEHFVNVFEGRRLVARLPYADSDADVVLAGEILEHVVDTEGFLREIRRVLRPGGSLVLSTPNVFWWKHRIELAAGRYPGALDYRARYGDDFGHVRAFGPSQVRELLRDAGFVDVVVFGKRLGSIGMLASGPPPVARALDRLADRLPSLSDTLVVYARRPAG